jgi:hypothetical protein
MRDGTIKLLPASAPPIRPKDEVGTDVIDSSCWPIPISISHRTYCAGDSSGKKSK